MFEKTRVRYALSSFERCLLVMSISRLLILTGSSMFYIDGEQLSVFRPL